MNDRMTRIAVGRDTTLAWQYERAMARFAICAECGTTEAPMVPVISDDTGALQFTCTGKRACQWRRQARSLQLAGVL